jgi:hypothetical protein
MENRAREYNLKDCICYVLTFNNLLLKSNFVSQIKEIFVNSKRRYNHHVDIEFTLNTLIRKLQNNSFAM